MAFKKMGMPPAKPKDDMFAMSDEDMSAELGEEGSPAEEASESPAMEALEAMSDEDLQKEMERRGFEVSGGPKSDMKPKMPSSLDEDLEGEAMSEDDSEYA